VDDINNKIEIDDASFIVSNEIKQPVNILEEMKIIEEQMKNPMFQTYKKSTQWNHLNTAEDNKNQEAILKDILECLLRIESKLN